MATHALLVTVEDRPGMLFKVTEAVAAGAGDIRYVDLLHLQHETEIFFECELPGAVEPILERLQAVAGVRSAITAPSMSTIYGKRIIIIGGGAPGGPGGLGAGARAG